MNSYTGKNALVIGGTSGIGLAAAQLLAERGAAVTVAGLEAARPDSLAGTPEIRWVACDVRDPAQVERAVEVAAGQGPVDWLVYSAGIQRYGNAVETPVEEWDLVQAVNARGAFLAAHFCVPRMAAGGAIVHVSSVQGLSCQAGVAAYAASKGTIDALTRAMALDFAGRGIRVNAVLPGTVDTPMVRASAERFSSPEQPADALMKQWGRMHPLGRMAQAREVAQAIAFLLSDEASFLTGVLLPVDGGLLAQLSVKL
jgi:NAD(P)-dependent dehydrogenase (short-subunit alcohol dehydrogenase family)